MKLKNYYISLFAFAVLLISCTDNRCNENTDVECKAEIVVNDAALESAQFIENLSIYSPYWIDSVHYSSTDYMLEFTPFSDTTIFIFTSLAWKDTLYILSKRDMIFLSQECGFVNNYKVDTAWFTTTNIDSIVWVNKKLTTQTDGHVKIYF